MDVDVDVDVDVPAMCPMYTYVLVCDAPLVLPAPPSNVRIYVIHVIATTIDVLWHHVMMVWIGCDAMGWDGMRM